MSNLSNRLRAWALNNEMIDVHFTEHGCDCVSASELLVQQDAEIERLRRENDDLNAGWQRTYDHDCNLLKTEIERLKTEIERLRTALVANDDGHTSYQSGWHARDAEVERLRELLRYAVPAGDAPKGWYQLVREARGE